MEESIQKALDLSLPHISISHDRLLDKGKATV